MAVYENLATPGNPAVDLTILEKAGYKVTGKAAGSTQFMVIANEREVIVAFRGTRIDGFAIPFLKTQGFTLNWGDVRKDAQFLPKEIEPGVLVHEGFHAAYEEIKDELQKTLAEAVADGRPLWFCGHSLGAALATIAAYKHRDQVHGLYTFGSPRVGNGAFVEAFSESLRNIWRFVHHHDAVTAMPPEGFGAASYAHAGQLRFITGRGTWKIDGGEGVRHDLFSLAADAVAHAKDVLHLLLHKFSLTDPGSWPIGVEAVADHSPIYYTNKIFNAHEEAVRGS